VRAVSVFLSGPRDSINKEAASVLIDLSDETMGTIKESLDVGGDILHDVAELISEASIAAGRLGRVLTFIGSLGFIVSVVFEIWEITEEAKQKDELISAIHDAQPARLSVAFFESEGSYIVQQVQLFQPLVEALANTANPNGTEAAKWLSVGLMSQMQATNTTADWTKLEEDVEKQDKTSSLYYGNDNLPTAQVVKLAKSEK